MGDPFARAELASRFGDLLDRCWFPEPQTPLTCAVSGGADSTALAVLAAAGDLDLTLAHVDHGLRTGSEHEAGVVAALADRVGAEFVSYTVTVSPGANLEARCRTARRSVLGDDIATGHTADDRAETVLINLLRGSGPTGLAVLAPSWHHPIAALRRSETHSICRDLDLTPIADPTNNDPRFVRNRVRHEVIPMLNEVANRDVTMLLCRHSDAAAEETAFVQAMAELLDPTDAPGLAAADPAIAAHAIRQWLTSAGRTYPPDAATVQRVLDVARGDAVATDVGGGWRVRRSRQRLFVDAPLTQPGQSSVTVT